MYNAQIIKERIDVRRQEKGVSNIETMLKELGIGKSTLWAMTDNKGIGCFALAKIADYLECSVDYLLGRTDTPNGTYSIKGDNNVQVNDNKGDYFTINNSEQPKPDSMIEDFMEVFKTLSFTNKVEAMKFVTDMTKNEV